MNSIYYIESVNFDTFFNRLRQEYVVFAPEAKEIPGLETEYFYRRILQDSVLVYNAYRAVEPLKAFFTYLHEPVAEYFTLQKNTTLTSDKAIIFGVKSCDIAGHKIQDFVFLEGVDVDSLYRLRRENTLLVSSDCIDFKEVCHCLAWEILPHPTEGFDLNMSPLTGGYLVESGSQKGTGLLTKYQDYFVSAKESQISARSKKRDNLIDCLRRHLLPQNLVKKDAVQHFMKAGYNADTWKQFMLTCVECGGCNFICDTCHCFLLADRKENQQNKKVRTWDSCLYANYARVSGGANPLKTRAQRLRNRFMKKFDFFIDNLGIPACCGCGRCIEVCPAKIDIREVLKDVAEKVNQAK